jgi:hypothetical protein
MSKSLLALAAAALLAAHAHAQPYPSKPIRFILPSRPAARRTRSRASSARTWPRRWRNRSWSRTSPGGRRHRRGIRCQGPPDGYTLFVGSNTQMAANPGLFKALSYNPVTTSRRPAA